MNFKEELHNYKEIVEEELHRILPKGSSPQDKVFEAMEYSIFAGGKRLRPILTLKTCELVGGDIKSAKSFAAALEMIHTYSLIHDDLPAMDDDNYRRGKLTNHKVFGEGIAILAGDGLLNYAYETMINHTLNNINESDKYIKAFCEIAKAAGVYGMIGGQVVDILHEKKSIDENTLNYIHMHKTSALIEASIISGALIGGATETELEQLRAYGKAIGLCFQIRDDILDKIGDKSKLGKDIGSDEGKEKATYLSFYGIEGSIGKTKELSNEAINIMNKFENRNKEFFINLAEYLLVRED